MKKRTKTPTPTPTNPTAPYALLTKEDLDLYPVYTDASLQALVVNPLDNLAGDYFLERGMPTSLVAGSSMGKSVLAQQIANALALGKPILGKIMVPRPVKVLLVQAENSGRVMKRNQNGIRNYFKVDKVDGNFVAYYPRGLVADESDKKDFFVYLERWIVIHKPDVVIIDPYQSFMYDSSINEDKFTKKWSSKMDILLRTYNFSLLLINHTNKQKAPKSENEFDQYVEQYAIAGAAKMTNWLRTVAVLAVLPPVLTEGYPRVFLFSCAKNSSSLGDTPNGDDIKQFMVIQSGNKKLPYWQPFEGALIKASQEIQGKLQTYARTFPKWELPPVTKIVQDENAKKFLLDRGAKWLRSILNAMVTSKLLIRHGSKPHVVYSVPGYSESGNK